MTITLRLLFLVIFIITCAEDKGLNNFDKNIYTGSDSTLDIITWNIENFPKENEITIDYLVEIIDSLNIDVIAMQEIGDDNAFNQLLSALIGWNGIRTSGSWGLAFIYRSELEINRIEEIQALDNYNLARTPLLMELVWGSEIIYIINNHYKCCGNGTIEIVYDDEEYRRLQSCILTKSYIDSNLSSDNVILLGDFNDELNDPDSSNVFLSFIYDNNNYLFVDERIANGSSANWSYPSWPSHLDHILITNELFDEFNQSESGVHTIHIEDYFEDGWNEYEKYISDHRPVGLSLFFNQIQN